jgi:hypothetical protein
LQPRSFFPKRNAELAAPAMAAQPSPEMARGDGAAEFRLVFMICET